MAVPRGEPVFDAPLPDAPLPDAPIFVDGQAQVVEGFSDPKLWVREVLWVEAEFDSDGDGKRDRMHVDVTRQRQTESGLKVPVVYESSPYFSGVAASSPKYMWDPHQELDDKHPLHDDPPAIGYDERKLRISDDLIAEWVPRGFAVVHSESPGTGLSQGAPTCGGANESLGPKAVIDWLNGRAKGFSKLEGGTEVKAYWTTGKVGMTGTSYNGTLCLSAATTGVEGLAAIIPVAPNTSYYRYYRANGLVRHPGGYMGEDMDVLYEFIQSGDPSRRKWADDHVRDRELIAGIDRRTGDWNDFWKERDYWLQLGKVTAPTLLAHGLNDWNVMPSHSTYVYQQLKKQGVPVQLFLHQGGHGGNPPFPAMNRWFTRWLYEVDNGVEDDPLCTVVREGASMASPTPYADWPNPDASMVVLRPRAGGHEIGALVAAVEFDAGAADSAKETLTDDAEKSGSELARADRSQHRLLYALPPLVSALHLSGTAKVTIRLACDKKAANLSVWLVSLPFTESRDTNANLITRGWADPRNHASIEKQEPLVPGKSYDVTFELEPDDQVIPAGEQIALMIFSSDRDFTLWPKAGTKLTVDLAGTSLELPVVGGAAALAAATAAQGR
ncbi:MAG: Xaa-Pro dipeptidyl-peptidase [Planctomycetes bacterium]|nr:Xaa-Pro dipeptidyl-peptidase [Planctomycetota bacterium]